MYCYLCSTKIEEGSSFCRNCGAESVAALSTDTGPGWLKKSGYFSLGVLLYAIVFLAASAIAAGLFPTAGPQLAILIGVLLGAIMSGLYIQLLLPERGRRKTRVIPNEPPAFTEKVVPQLPEPRSFYVPDSVVESTTNKLTIDR
jgi:hypothetical protein